eukprot:gene8029-13941_t
MSANHCAANPQSRPSKWNDDNSRNVSNYSKRYGLSEKSLAVEHSLFGKSGFYQLLMKEIEERAKNGLKNPCLPLILKLFKESDLQNLYPTLHRALIIAACIPVTTASCERSHSRVKLINTYLRAKMGEADSSSWSLSVVSEIFQVQ